MLHVFPTHSITSETEQIIIKYTGWDPVAKSINHMKKIAVTIFMLATGWAGMAQTVETKYYNKNYDEVDSKKATISEIITQNQDGTVTTTTNTLKKGKVIGSHTFKGDEPYGIWIYQRGSGPAEMDYDFLLEYTDRDCADEHVPLTIESGFESSDIPGYTAPEIGGGEASFRSFLLRNLVYPAHARRLGIQGGVHLVFDITKEGKIENVAVRKGVHVVLDKEAVRLIRKLKLASPALINGQPKDFCVTMPLWFKLS